MASRDPNQVTPQTTPQRVSQIILTTPPTTTPTTPPPTTTPPPITTPPTTPPTTTTTPPPTTTPQTTLQLISSKNKDVQCDDHIMQDNSISSFVIPETPTIASAQIACKIENNDIPYQTSKRERHKYKSLLSNNNVTKRKRNTCITTTRPITKPIIQSITNSKDPQCTRSNVSGSTSSEISQSTQWLKTHLEAFKELHDKYYPFYAQHIKPLKTVNRNNYIIRFNEQQQQLNMAFFAMSEAKKQLLEAEQQRQHYINHRNAKYIRHAKKMIGWVPPKTSCINELHQHFLTHVHQLDKSSIINASNNVIENLDDNDRFEELNNCINAAHTRYENKEAEYHILNSKTPHYRNSSYPQIMKHDDFNTFSQIMKDHQMYGIYKQLKIIKREWNVRGIKCLECGNIFKLSLNQPFDITYYCTRGTDIPNLKKTCTACYHYSY